MGDRESQPNSFSDHDGYNVSDEFNTLDEFNWLYTSRFMRRMKQAKKTRRYPVYNYYTYIF